ncbi:hypothetical protein MP638_001376 [Amoeboaphelidium occidentale]|nr:hypothetical protein MP638_001376 [Amoeboaphelidium occidentale]
MKLDFDDLVQFQASSEMVFTVTTDTSFYCQYFKEKFSEIAIWGLYRRQGRIINWKKVVQRLFNDPFEYVQFFYENAIRKLSHSKSNEYLIVGCEYERLGYGLGTIFSSLFMKLSCKWDIITIGYVHKIISDIREENLELVKNPIWHYFEDILYSDFRHFLQHESNKIKNLKDVEYWLVILSFANKKDNSLFQQTLVKFIVVSIVKNVAIGSIDCNNAIEHIKFLLPQLKNMEDVKRAGDCIEDAVTTHLQALSEVYDFLLKEIIGKRRNNYTGFFKGFVSGFVLSLNPLVVQQDNVQAELEILKHCLKWRFVVPDGEWRELQGFTLRICIVDDAIRDIFFNKGFYLDHNLLDDITRLMNEDCSDNFRKACEQYLYSTEYVSGESKLDIAAKESCRSKSQ